MELRHVPEQIPLFDIGIDVARLRAAQDLLMQSSRARNTIRAYKHSWGIFLRWCDSAGRNPLPAEPDTIALFVVWSIEERHYRLETIRTNVSAIRAMHKDTRYPSPVNDAVRELMVSAARQLREAPAGKLALPPEYVRSMCEIFLEKRTLWDLRDHAMVLLGFASGWRRSELVSVRVQDVSFVRRGMRVRLGASKTDQDGSEGREIGIPFGREDITCPVKAMRAWLHVRGRRDGPLFAPISLSRGVGVIAERALCPEVVNIRLQRALTLIGKDASVYGAHSLRSGMVTASAENGADLPAIMQRTGHKSIEMVLRYVRPARAFRSDPLAGVL